MPYSDVDICNKALTRLGAARITSLTQDSTSAKHCNAIYSMVRDALLEEHPWNFATKRGTLQQLSVTPNYEFTYAYGLPSDYVRILEINEVDIGSQEYKIENAQLLIDASTCKVRYIYKNTDVGSYSNAFIEALSARMCAELAYPITESNSIIDREEKRASFVVAQAKAIDAQGSGTPINPKQDLWIKARANNSFGRGYISLESS